MLGGWASLKILVLSSVWTVCRQERFWACLFTPAETWPAANEDVRKLQIVQMYCVHQISGYSAWITESNQVICVKHAIPPIVNVIRYHRLRWFCHVALMDPERLPVQVIFGPLEGKRLIGRPSKTWIDTLRDDLRVILDLNNKRGTFIASQTLTQDRGQ